MSDMYDKLGDLLNNVLEKGEVPQEEISKDQNPGSYKDERENSDPFFMSESLKNPEKAQKTANFTQKSKENYPHNRKINTFEEKINEGKVYKAEYIDSHCINMHKYTKIMHIPCIVSKSLDTLHIASLNGLDLSKLKSIYHELLKENHPDTAKNNSRDNNTIDEIRTAYNTVKIFLENQ